MQCRGWTGGQDGCAAVTYNAGTNRLATIGTQSVQYDAAGNLVQDGTGTGSKSYQWDAEGRMTSVSVSGLSSATFSYKALGQRVEKNLNNGTYTEYVYDAAGNVIGTFNRAVWLELFMPLGGRIFAKYASAITYFMHANPLGTSLEVTDNIGTLVQDLTYYPHGTRAVYVNTGIIDERFASLSERDPESYLDWTANRVHDPTLMRWLSPDPSGVKAVSLTDPQTWNMYAYVRNNPMTLTDPSGLEAKSPPQVDLGGELTPDPPSTSGGATGCAAGTTTCISQEENRKAVNSVIVLGSTVAITYDPKMSDTDKLAASDKLVAAAGVVNGAADKLTGDEKAAIHNVKSISVSAGEGKDDPRTAIAPSGNENFRLSYLTNPGSTAAWTASAIAHDAYHLVTDPKGTLYGPDTAAGLEKKSNAFQMQVGAKFGLTPNQLDYIKNDTHTLYNTNPY